MSSNGGLCKWPYAIVDGVRVHISEAARATHGTCPLCGEELIARKGKVREDHWWHKNGDRCDDWYQPKGPWHHYWQDKFPKEWQEQVITRETDGVTVKHVADVLTDSNLVIEAQYSAISPDDIEKRENFYGDMAWIVNMTRIYADLDLRSAIRPHGTTGQDGQRQCFAITDHGVLLKQKWCHCSRPVFFDFKGTFEHPEESEELFLLLPDKPDARIRICFCMQQEEVAKLLTTPGALAEELSALNKIASEQVAKISEEQEIERQKREQNRIAFREANIARALERDEENRRIIEERDQEITELCRYTSIHHAQAFVLGSADYTCSFVMTIGWVEAFLICAGVLNNIQANLPNYDTLSGVGRMGIHFLPGYSYEKYKLDLEKARQVDFAKSLPDYDTLKKFEKQIRGAVSFLKVKVNGEYWLFFKRACLFNRKFESWNNSEGIWKPTDLQQNALTSIDANSKVY